MNKQSLTRSKKMARAHQERGYTHNPHFQNNLNRRVYPGNHQSLNTINYPNSLINGDGTHTSSNTSPSSRLSLKQTSQVVAKNVQFFRSGDPHPQSIKIAITKRNFRTFDALLETLSDKVPLPFGVRTISTPHGTHGINRLDEFEDGKAYVCSDRKTVKPMDLENIQSTKPPWFISKPKTRNKRMAALVRQSDPVTTEVRLPNRMNHVKTPKKVIIVKNGDPTFRHSILLSRRTPQSFEQILDDIGEIFRMKAHKIFTQTGRRMESLQDLFMGPSLCIVTGRENFITMDYKIRRSSKKAESSSNAGESSDQGIASSVERMPKELKKTKGRWRVCITTSELPAAGTDSNVFITMYGGKGSSGPIQLAAGNESGNSVNLNKDAEKKLFMSGNEDEFAVNVGFIGEVNKIRIHHDNSGSSPGWLCDTVTLTDLTTGEVLHFPFNRWLSRDEDDGDICRELPVIRNGEIATPVLRYIVTISTGDLWNAGTSARVYITLYGANGDSGTRLLQKNGKPVPLHKGTMETFRFEAVSLGHIQKLVIGHDGIGAGNGWFLNRITVREDRVESEDYVFTLNRWLDEGEDDSKIVRELLPDKVVSHHLHKNRQTYDKARDAALWEQEKWKFGGGNHIMFISKSTNKAIRTKPDASVDALGDVSHPFGVYEVVRRKNNVRVFANVANPSYHLAIDQNRFLGQGKGGQYCEFAIRVLEDRSVTLESCRYPGHHVTVDPLGKSVDTRGQNSSIGRQFIVYVKGCFRNGSIILFNTSPSQALVVTSKGEITGTGKRGDITDRDLQMDNTPRTAREPQFAYFRVVKVAQSVRMFQCEKNPRRYLRIKDGQCDGMGTGDVYCHFKIQKYKQSGFVTLQSMKHRGVFIGLSANGKARPTVDTGDTNTQFYPEVIKFGERKKENAERWKTPEPSFVEQEATTSREDRKKTATKSSKHIATMREDSNATVEDGAYRVYVTTGNAGTTEVVSLTVYGDNGEFKSITLGKGRKGGAFQCGQTDEFQVNFGSIKNIFKIRIGVEEASSDLEWRLKQVKMKNMATNEVCRFKYNRWLSRNKDDGDTMRELPLGAESENPSLKMYRYFVQLRTSKDSSPVNIGYSKDQPLVYLCIYGKNGDTGRRLLHKRSRSNEATNTEKLLQRRLYIPGQGDKFEIEAVNLGEIKKCVLSCPTSLHASRKKSANADFSLLCDQIIIRESRGSTTEYVFDCKKWLGLKKPGAHAQINLPLKEKREVKPSVEDETNFEDGDWKLCITTGVQSEPTTANIVFEAFGDDKSTSGPIVLGNNGLFDINSTVKFKANLSAVKNLQKIRIGHQNEGSNPSWHLDSIKLINVKNDISYNLPVKKWLSLDRENYQIFTEIPIPRPGVEKLPVINYNVSVYTGSILGSDTDANVYLCVYGANGDSGKRPLHKSLNNDPKFQESQMDRFELEAVHLGELTKIVIGHDGVGPGNGWFLHKVIITEGTEDSKEYLFFCNKWLDDGQDDGKVERQINVEPFQQTSTDKAFDGEYEVLISSGAMTSAKKCPDNMRITLVVYGDDGKTGELLLNSDPFEPEYLKSNQTNKFKIDIPDIGKIYKVRLSYNEDSGWGPWFVEKVVLRENGKSDLTFPCNRFLSTQEDDYETVKEIAIDNGTEMPLKSVIYHVTVFTGDRHGAECDANVHIMLKGERGDTGKRWLKNSVGEILPFQRSGVDVFMIEAVDLGRLTEIVIGHTGKGYGAGWYMEKVTIREGEFSSTEVVFPCHAWLDDHIGDCKTVRRLNPLGILSLDGQEEELQNLAIGTPTSRDGETTTMWDITISIDEIVCEELTRVHLTGVFYGNGGSMKTDAISFGEWSAGGRKTFSLQSDLKDIGEIYKLRVEMEDYKESVDILLNSITVQNVHTKEQLIFAFHRHLKTETGSTTKELPALKVGRSYAKVIRYVIDIAMSSHNPTDGLLLIKLTGDSGDSGFRTLVKGVNARHAIPKDGGYLFNLDAVDLGRLTHVSLAYVDSEYSKSTGWNVKHLFIKVQESQNFNAGFVQQPTVYSSEIGVTFKISTNSNRVEKEFALKENMFDETVSYSSRTDNKQEINVKPITRGSDGIWSLTLSYINYDESGDAKELSEKTLKSLKENFEQVQFFGSTNCSKVFTLHEHDIKVTKHSTTKSFDIDDVTVNLPIGSSIGQLYSMRLTCQQWKATLTKIRLVETETNQTFLAYLSAPHHRKAENTPAIELNRIVSSLDIPLVRPDIPPLEHHRYKVFVSTGNQPAADTDANVYIKISGTSGDTGKRLLFKRADKLDIFKKGAKDEFEIESTDIGEPRKITIGHDGKGRGKGWFLEDVVIGEFRDGRRSEYIFNNHKWLDDSVDDKVTERDLYLTGARINFENKSTLTSAGSWKCRIKTKEIVDPDAVTTARISFYLKHKDQPIVHSCQFEGSESEFITNFTAKEEGDQQYDGFYKIRVEHVITETESHVATEWPFNEFLMTDTVTDEKLRFIFDESPVWEGSARGMVRELPVARMNQELLKVNDYYVVFYTSGDSSKSFGQRNVYVQIHGSQGDTGWRKLCSAKNLTNTHFQPNRVDMFSIEAVDLGESIQSVSLRVQGGDDLKWKLDKIKIKEGYYSEDENVFEFNRWIGGSQSKKIGTDVIEKVERTSMNKSVSTEDASAIKTSKSSYQICTDWEFISSKDATATNPKSARETQPLLATKLYGTKAYSELVVMNVEDQGKERVHCEAQLDSVDLGELLKIGIGIENFSEANKELWMRRIDKITLLKLSIHNTTNNDYCSFRPNHTFYNKTTSNKDDDTTSINWLELVMELPKQVVQKDLEMVEYSVSFQTGDIDEAGTDADVYITLLSDTSDSGKRWMFQSKPDNEFTRGSVATFEFDGVSLNEIKQVIVGHNGSNASSGWYLEKVVVKPSNKKGKSFVFVCQKFLADLEDDSFIERTLDLHHTVSPENTSDNVKSENNPENKPDEDESIAGNTNNNIE